MMKKRVMMLVMGVVITFGVSAKAVVMELVTVGNAGNGPDTRYRGYGSVGYTYQIGKYEVTAGEYTAFLNAVAKTDTYGLYNESMWTVEQGCKIQRSGSPGNYSYSVASDWANRPVGYVSWGDAARFTNWLTNGQPIGNQNADTTEDGSYYLNGAMSTAELNGVTRKIDAIYVIPSQDELYKAAYHKNDGITDNYWDYPTGTNAVPSNSVINPDPGNNANFSYAIGSPYWGTEVGEFENSESPYGTFDQGGNVWEWNEAVENLQRGLSGGSYTRDSTRLWAGFRDDSNPTDEIYTFGFRVASVPESTIPPDANSNGPYTVFVGDPLTLDGSGSTDPDDDIVSYLWDLDDDEIYETDAGSEAIFTVGYAYLESINLLVNHTYTIHLKVTDSEGQSDIAESTFVIVPKPAVKVAFDIKPGSCPNPLNTKSSGVLPVAILGSVNLDVTTIDPTSILLAGVQPIRSSLEDVATPLVDANDCECTELGPDGFIDLTLKFETQKIVEAIGEVNHGDIRELLLTGILYNPAPYETPLEGKDCIVIKGRHKPINKADINEDGLVNVVDIAIVAENWMKSSIVEK